MEMNERVKKGISLGEKVIEAFEKFVTKYYDANRFIFHNLTNTEYPKIVFIDTFYNSVCTITLSPDVSILSLNGEIDFHQVKNLEYALRKIKED